MEHGQSTQEVHMLKKWLVRFTSVFACIACAVIAFVAVAYADSMQSPNYSIDESALGNGGFIQSNSNSFQSSGSVGETAVGDSASTNYQVQSSSQTTSDPTLGFSITNGDVSFGTFSASGATTTTSTFSVSNYTSYGYVVQIVGSPPTDTSGHTITPMGTTGASQAGTEQFGMNLVANTSPTNFGANPDHGQFGFGSATANYGTPNVFRYVSGESIASAPRSSGVTTYTISYLVNVTPLTPGGQYAGGQTLVCTGTY